MLPVVGTDVRVVIPVVSVPVGQEFYGVVSICETNR